MRVAVLGAGNAGVCAALELAARGQAVDLYDENPEPILRASRNNEGKVHLGLVYARDRSLATARTMIWGAIHFIAYLRRWIDIDLDEHAVSSAFYYLVHEATMTSPDELAAHYSQCKRLLEDACAATGLAYLDRDRILLAEAIPRPTLETLAAPRYFSAAFRTSERAVDPRVVADRLAAAVRAQPRIRFIPNARVTALARTPRGLRVAFRVTDGDHVAIYDQVVNTLWHGRLEIDGTLGLTPERAWIYRYKLGGWVRGPVAPETPASITAVLGPFGDIVNFGARGLYFSWYPTGMIGTSRALQPPDWEASLTTAARCDIVRRSYDEWLKRCPALRALPYADDLVDPVGGVIFAWGATDIHADHSRLHTRHEIGIHSVDGYHSVNTGKYTMTPYLGYRTAERVLGIS